MSDLLARANAAIEESSPALFSALSPLGRQLVYPPGIPFQAGQARGKKYNATIGQLTDGAGHALRLPSLAAAYAALDEEKRNKALLYSPAAGIPEVRRAWRQRQRAHLEPGASASSLPIVTVGLTHCLSILADLFCAQGSAVAVVEPFWGNYRQTFGVRRGAEILASPAYVDDGEGPRFAADGVARSLGALPEGEPALVVVNLPSNPSGYSLTRAERDQLRKALVEAAALRPIVAICDDAYAGFVYEEEIPRGSMFWELAGQHPNLIPVKVEGATKELGFFGGRVGFLTFPFAADSAIAEALESKIMDLSRATIGSPVSASQMVVLGALESRTLEEEVEALRQRLAGRYRILRDRLATFDPAVGRALPFNSGCFALIELARGLDSEAVRQRLLADHDTGLISIAPNYIRIAHCSVRGEALPELVDRLERGASEVAVAVS